LPILAVSIFRYIAFHFDARLASTVYMVGVSFGHSLGLAILSPIVGKGYDLYGFPATYMMIAGFALTFWLVSLFALSPTPPEIGWRKDADPGPIVTTFEPPGGADVEPAHGEAR
jgi:OHS family lactose permease-like MFS transporter